ncbi:glycoside hydrolase family 66 protein [Agromyces bauzanensis]
MSSPSLLPTRASYAAGEPVAVEVSAPDGARGTLSVWRLGELVHRENGVGSGIRSLDALGPGGYGLELEVDGVVARTAIEVTDDDRARLRYGFVASYRPGKDTESVARFARRLHLNGILFYDWAYRHAELLGGGEQYDDALGQPISLATVRELVGAVQAVGSRAYGYAAVYAVGPNEWDRWNEHALLAPSGEPYALGDFLFLVDPAATPWLEHFRGELARAVEEIGFDGFHLDQYGYPKFAAAPDGRVIDVSDSFLRGIQGVREALPGARLVFNNVNDFPTWRTASAPQDAVYIEVWEPHLTLGALAAVVNRARAVRSGQPIVVAAYQHVYDRADAAASDRATALTMATLFSHGATQLLAGEAGRLLVDPYYVRNHAAEPQTLDLLTRWYDFLVEHDALLLDPAIIEVTGSYAGDYNGDLDVSYLATPVTAEATAGAVWRRITSTPQGLVVHLVNLLGQADTLWDAPRAEPESPGEGILRFRFVRGRTPRVRYADPDGQARLVDLPIHLDGDVAVVTLPEPNVWQVVHVEL